MLFKIGFILNKKFVDTLLTISFNSLLFSYYIVVKNKIIVINKDDCNILLFCSNIIWKIKHIRIF